MLTYPNAVYGAEALRVLSEKRDAAAARSIQSAASFPFGAMSLGRERYICGVLRRFPTGLGLPSSQELANLCTAVVFEGDVKFAVPARHAAQLALLKGKYPSLRVLKKVSPLEQMCSQCFKKGHSRRQCTLAKQLCKHHVCTECPSLTGMREQWLPCVLCDKRGHCVTSCPQFQPQLIPVELKPKKSEFALQPQEFPAPQAAQPASAAAAAPAPRQSTPAAAPASAKVAKAAAPAKSKSYAAVTAAAAAADPMSQSAKPASAAPPASALSSAAPGAASSAAAGADAGTLHAILQKLTSLSDEIAALCSSLKVLSVNQEGLASRVELLCAGGPNEYADVDDLCLEIEDDQEEEKSAGPVQPARSAPAARA